MRSLPAAASAPRPLSARHPGAADRRSASSRDSVRSTAPASPEGSPTATTRYNAVRLSEPSVFEKPSYQYLSPARRRRPARHPKGHAGLELVPETPVERERLIGAAEPLFG